MGNKGAVANGHGETAAATPPQNRHFFTAGDTRRHARGQDVRRPGVRARLIAPSDCHRIATEGGQTGRHATTPTRPRPRRRRGRARGLARRRQGPARHARTEPADRWQRRRRPPRRRGDDTLRGLRGDDTLVGGVGRDLLIGGPADDVINARDGRRDTVSCGSGQDTVVADDRDVVPAGCEQVRYSAEPAPATGFTLYVNTVSSNNGSGVVHLLREHPTKFLPDCNALECIYSGLPAG